MNIADWIVAYLARWLPRAASTGLFPIGKPDRRSPVLVTANFSLTVRRVRRALAMRNVWLLVVPTDGINVWCAAASGIFTHHRIIDAVKVADLAAHVDHRELILPALCAAGVDRMGIGVATGFRAVFGPVLARDIPAFLDAGKKKSDGMLRFRFDLRHRLEMLLPMNLPIYLLLAAILVLFQPHVLAPVTLLFWAIAVFLYVLVPHIPGRTGWMQALECAGLAVSGWLVWDWLRFGHPLLHWGWYLGTVGLFLMVGFDLAGIATARKSDPEKLLCRLGIKSLGSLYAEKDIGEITLRRERCAGCRTCWEICPVSVYGDLDDDGKTTFRHRDACFNCGACVRQCPSGALAIRAAAGQTRPGSTPSLPGP